MMSETADLDGAAAGPKARGGRPTRAAAAERDERLLDIATTMFLDHGFDATSMDRIAEAAAVGKATLYARYADKGALFTAVLRRRILQVYAPIEAEFGGDLAGTDLEATLNRVARRLIEKGLAKDTLALGRILSAHGPRFPDLARLAIEEGIGRQTRLVETVLRHFAGRGFVIDDLTLAADLFLAITIGRSTRLAIYGIPVDAEAIIQRAEIAVGLFVRGLLKDPRA